jgi:hypothetical protein
MSGKDNQNSIPSKGDSELKNPDRRQMLGVAAIAAAFTTGQVGSVEAQGKKKPPEDIYGELVDPTHLPGETKPGEHGYQPVSHFHDLGANKVFKKGALYRQSVSKYARDLRKRLGLSDSDFMHVVRLEARPGGRAEGNCGCCCC